MSILKAGISVISETCGKLSTGSFATITTRRFFSRSTTPVMHSYEGDGKTNVTIHNFEMDSPLMVDSYHEHGFKLNNGMSVVGPMAIFPKTVLAWDVKDSDSVTPETLSLFVALEPKLDILVIGVGDAGNKIPKETIMYLKKHKINMEILRTEHACSTFNFLNVEKRCVAAAIIPPRNVKYFEDDSVFRRIDKKKLHSEDE